MDDEKPKSATAGSGCERSRRGCPQGSTAKGFLLDVLWQSAVSQQQYRRCMVFDITVFFSWQVYM